MDRDIDAGRNVGDLPAELLQTFNELSGDRSPIDLDEEIEGVVELG